MSHSRSATLYIRNFIFGVEDSLVSTVGMLSGIAVAGVSRADIVIAGTVLIFVEAFSMGAGSFLSEYSSEEFADVHRVNIARALAGAVIMFVSYFVAGFVPLSPYALAFVGDPFATSIGASLVALFLLGAWGGRVSGLNPISRGVRMFAIGGSAILLGIIVGNLFR